MKVKLIKTNEEFMLNPPMEGFKLSLKNCQAIERGYDLDDLIDIYAEDWKFDERIGFRSGFQKALELMGDKKFSEEDVRKVIMGFYMDDKILIESNINKQIQSLQQTEWDVEIEMEYINIGAVSSCFHPKDFETEIIKRDGDGCLILKRI